MGEWVSDDPGKAFAYSAGAGAAILLMDDLYPEFALLGQQLAERRATAGGEGGGGFPDDEEPVGDGSGVDAPGGDLGGLDTGAFGSDLGGFDLAALEIDFGGFEGLAAAFNAVDAGVDAGGGGDGEGG